ncbi:MAG: sensor domain-containing diguanylate cyclase [Calditrichaeota bacterium]|nr:sensor domain-containing diguanylate cyclase [Calditrichota bacterium]
MPSRNDLQHELEKLSQKYEEIRSVNQELAGQLRELYILYNISHILSTTFEIKQILRSIFHLFKDSLPVDSAHLFLLAPLQEELGLKESFGFSKLPSKIHLQPEPQLIERVAVTGSPLTITDIKTNTPSNFLFAGFPLFSEDEQIIGVLSFFRDTKRVLKKSEFDFLKRISDEVAVCINRALLFHRTRESTILDELTGIFNRRYFNKTFQREIKRAERYKRNLSVLMIDIDDFKVINDTFGHLKGDDVLQAIAAILKNNIRRTDILFRYGGEEFVILLPETPLNSAIRVGEKLRKAVQGHFNLTDYQISGQTITISIGISNFPMDGYSTEKLLAIADRHLYQAKSLGKNRTIAHEELLEKA